MAYVVQVDQSGKIEDTATDTVIAFANGRSYAILISASVKRACIQALRDRGKTGRTLYRRLFTVGVFLLLETYIDEIDAVIIDEEYTGQEASIKQELLILLRAALHKVESSQIQFGRIHQAGGKNPPAHQKAHKVRQGIHKADRIVSEKELLERIK